MMRRKRILFLFLLVGLTILNYPFLSQWVNRYSQSQVIRNYQEDAGSLSQAEQEEMLQKAREYNEALANEQGIMEDAFSGGDTDERYESLLNPYEGGVMGYLEIPKIDVMLPVYHGTSVEVLEKGVGHLYGSSLPVGGESTHAVLSSHRGLSEKSLFTDLDMLEEGDHFYITTGTETLAYEVDDIRTVKPDETESLVITPGKDYVTLVTCTPYGINSHRLLVRGTRVAYISDGKENREEEIVSGSFWFWMKVFFTVSIVIIIISGYFLVIPHGKYKRKDGKKWE